ncbi:TonB family protein [Erwinia sp. V71]|uniref:TonB family protein n=1 Tax=Erwinia sp. V71 TaxID=3369424 RepID=UPI003F5EB3A7
MAFLRAKPEPSWLMAGREGGVMAMTLLSVAESRPNTSATAAANVTMLAPPPQSAQQAAATVTVPDAVIPLRNAAQQQTRADQPTRTEKPRTPPRPEKPLHSSPQRNENPARQEKRITTAVAERPSPSRETASHAEVSPNKVQAAQTHAVNGATSSTSAEKTGSASSGHAAQGAGSSNNASFKALHRRVNYPQRAKALGVEGRVRIQFDVTASGTVTNVRILSETPRGVFAAAIQPDITRWRYQTQQAVSDQVVSIVFKLNGQVQLEN